MAKTKRKKKRIKEDSFVTWSLKASKFAQDHFNQIIIGVVILVVVIAFFLFTTHARRGALIEAEQLFGTALELYRQNDIEGAKKSFSDISEQYSRVRPGIVSLYFKGECNLKQSNYSEAIAAFESYIRKSNKYPLFKEAAIIGKALALEGTQDFQAAAMVLEQLASEMDKDDPRYISTIHRTAIYYIKTDVYQHKAKPFFEEVAEKGTGKMKQTAEAYLDIIEGNEQKAVQ